MKFLRYTLLCVLTGLFMLPLGFITAQTALAIQVEAEGMAAVLNNNVAGARKQAILNAQRNAVEQGVGTLVDSRTVVKNMDLIRDEILTSSQGFVAKYVVLSEGVTPDRANFKVRIKATVSDKLLKDRLAALRILHQKMGNKRIMVIYQSNNKNALERNHGANRAALQTIRQELNKAGFRLFNESATKKVYSQIERATRTDRPVEDLIAMALDQRADLLVRFENIAGKRGAKGGMFSAAFSTIRLSVFDTNTGRQVADAQTEAKQLLQAKAGAYDWEKALSDASSKASRQASNEAINNIANYYKQVDSQGFNYLVVFRNFDDDEKDVILDFMENTRGFKDLSELKNTRDYMEIELFSDQNTSRLRRMIRSGLKEKGIQLQVQSTSRNRIIFSNPNKQ